MNKVIYVVGKQFNVFRFRVIFLDKLHMLIAIHQKIFWVLIELRQERGLKSENLYGNLVKVSKEY